MPRAYDNATISPDGSARSGAMSATNEGVFPGYNLFSPLNSTDTYLMTNDGEIIHDWPSDYQPASSVYLLENGNVLRPGRLDVPIFAGGGAGGVVQEISPGGSVVWQYEFANDQHRLHHDVERLPNGNVLMIAWELKTAQEAIDAGRDPSLLIEGELWPDIVIEVEPAGATGGRIVWEWHVFDHLIQDYDPTKANFGVVPGHPERIDLNFVRTESALPGSADWQHCNAIDYNAEFDQIMLSVHHFGEIWIIDHSTTTAEAAGRTGGNSGKGGDLLYRWGNPQAYGAGDESDQKFFGQHDAQWIAAGLPGAGNILVFNNGSGRPEGYYSSIEEITPPVDASGGYSIIPGSSYGPEAQAWVYTADNPIDFYASFISGAQRLPNGNTLVCNGPIGSFFEVDAEKETVWAYDYGERVFRVTRYATDYPGLPASYLVVDTAQDTCYDDAGRPIVCPAPGDHFYGQDAHYGGRSPKYLDNGDGTVTDLQTGLTWQQDPGEKMTLEEAEAGLSSFDLGGYADWRMPTIKELYSLIRFTGVTGSSKGDSTPYIDTDFFVFNYGDTVAGERFIDAQYLSGTLYAGTTMNGDKSAFGVNFADGRIKGYGLTDPVTQEDKEFFVIYVRGKTGYGTNRFVDNGDGTITDTATGLMWMRVDSGALEAGDGADGRLNWRHALQWAETLEYAGYLDWRLPNAKELQSIVDYTRSPQSTGSAAIDPSFSITSLIDGNGETNYPYFWTGTTHLDGAMPGEYAVYIAFGEAQGYMEIPPGSGNYQLLDVHGAGAQRSDPKDGDPSAYPYGHGPQGDVISIFNFVRCVRGVSGNGDGIPESNLVLDFGTDGTWLYDGWAWDQISPLNPAQMTEWGGRVAMDFPGYGVYAYDGEEFGYIHWYGPESMVQWGDRLAMDYEMYGVYTYDGNALVYVHWLSPEMMVQWADRLVLDYGRYGTYAYDGSDWTFIHVLSPDDMVVWESYLVADFSDWGVWGFDGNDWIFIQEANPEGMVVWRNQLVFDFGSAGVYIQNDEGGTIITYADPEDMAPWEDLLVLDLGGEGIYVYDGAYLKQISRADPEGIAVLHRVE
ncbi:MAG: DUF1566 domain-containing protein [Deltaproteobacteria bacterium]|nr:DUF1566 domain-containing protein [Deltaproteobacteria bacterium]